MRVDCGMSYQWQMGCVKREEHGICITKPCTHKADGSGINEMIFANFSRTFGDLIFINVLMLGG